MNRLARRAQPVPAPARRQSGGLVLRGATRRSRARAPRTSRSSCRSATRRATGATSWSTSRSRTPRSPTLLNARLRVDQGRPRGAARRRPRLHDVRAGDDRRGRLADDGLPDARAEAVLRRHLLSADVAVGPARLHGPARRDRARVERRSRRASTRRPAELTRAAAGGDRHRRPRRRRVGRSPAPTRSTTARRAVPEAFDRAARRLRRGAEVPASVGTAVPAARARARPGVRSRRC